MRAVAIDSLRPHLVRSLGPITHETPQINGDPFFPETTYLHFLALGPDNRPLRHRCSRRVAERTSLVALDREGCVISAVDRARESDVGSVAHVGRNEASEGGVVGGADGHVAHDCGAYGGGGSGGVVESNGEVFRGILGPVEVEACHHLDGLADKRYGDGLARI